MFDSAHTCTPMQRFVYVMAKNHHTDDPNDGPDPAGVQQGQQFKNATNKF